MEKREGMRFVAELPGQGWKIKNVANLFMVAVHPDHQPILIWKDGTIQSLPFKPQ